ncbi:MAG: glutamate--tRNA ligase [bacterium]|jgi:glutamyl-tRNA synthetase
MPNVVTRFAPSPTGRLTIGGVRTALFSWLYARNNGGKFILRIEDTDQERSTPENVQVILDSLSWLGIDWDEGPYFQTQRMELYRKEAERLVAEGKAYRCVCTKEELDARRKEMESRKEKPRYDGRCRNVPENEKAGKPSVIRFKAPPDGETEVRDLVLKKTIVFRNAELDDLILIRTDGWPTYNFVVAVDDSSMGVTHVLRGDDHLNNTPKQILIYHALGYPVPHFGHFPLIHGTEGGKMSKRDGKDFDDPSSLGYYPRHGFLPEAVVNYLARLGWGHGDQEIFSVEELKSLFTLEGTNNSPSRFDMTKLLHLNAHYIKSADPSRIAALLLPFLERLGIEAVPSPRLTAIVRTLQERARTLEEMAESAEYYFREKPTDPKAAAKFLTPAIAPVLDDIAQSFSSLDTFTPAGMEETLHAVVERHGGNLKVHQPIRVALTGGTASPGLFEVMEILGRDEVVRRLKAAVTRIGA